MDETPLSGRGPAACDDDGGGGATGANGEWVEGGYRWHGGRCPIPGGAGSGAAPQIRPTWTLALLGLLVAQRRRKGWSRGHLRP
jgi:hypothetical protein